MLEAKYQQDDCISCLPHSKAIYQNIFEDKDGGEDERGNRISEPKPRWRTAWPGWRSRPGAGCCATKTIQSGASASRS